MRRPNAPLQNARPELISQANIHHGGFGDTDLQHTLKLWYYPARRGHREKGEKNRDEQDKNWNELLHLPKSFTVSDTWYYRNREDT
ncbi:hypothetical protein SKAU_G00339680 [Synaphobranchus kaupii]|uniref:Uncharacterized protein n=1 Tax=Synaphobranchus kaupii TaxID=118154 RepID=A0A9Q1EMX1_SYNKA|nr:hypothetical protein SKAU_G00339680 [Synaphobranchus kaupii]